MMEDQDGDPKTLCSSFETMCNKVDAEGRKRREIAKLAKAENGVTSLLQN